MCSFNLIAAIILQYVCVLSQVVQLNLYNAICQQYLNKSRKKTITKIYCFFFFLLLFGLRILAQ